MFPLYKNDGKSSINLSNFQIENINIVKSKIEKGTYKLINNDCLCGNKNTDQDIIISEKDRYGFNIEQILCSKCGLIRSGKVLETNSNNEFYKNEYRSIYVGNGQVPVEFFENQTIRGISFLKLFEDIVGKQKNSSVFEIGCGAGGILSAWEENGYRCSGCDFNENYLNFGIKQGLTLHYGDYNTIVIDDSTDVIILSHVMEHFLDPIKEIQKIIEKIKKGGYLIMEVPGIFYINKMYFNPILFFQNAHTFNYHFNYLKIFFEELGLEILYGDERCTFILKKPNNYIKKEITEIYSDSLSIYPNKIKEYLWYCKYFLYINPIYIANKILTPLGLYKIAGKIYFKITKFIGK